MAAPTQGDQRWQSAPAKIARGAQIGDYEVLRRINAGGMAELYLAKRVGLEGFRKVVALKRILPHLAEDPEFVAMFLAEARLAARLEHPNIVHVSDFGNDGEHYFFAMAYVHGTDVLSIIRRAHELGATLPIEDTLTIALGACAGLHYAHELTDFDGTPLGIVHRDVSPSNLLVTWDGNVKVVDFGIAKAAARTNVTRAGVRKGKASYMAPEQCRGHALDRRADIWTIGVLLYELVTMRRLFQADDELATLHKVVTGDFVPARERAPLFAPEFAAVVDRCLSLDPDDRFSTALEVRRALESFAHDAHISMSTDRLSALLHEFFDESERQPPWIDDRPPAGTTRPAAAPEPPAQVTVRQAPQPQPPKPQPVAPPAEGGGFERRDTAQDEPAATVTRTWDDEATPGARKRGLLLAVGGLAIAGVAAGAWQMFGGADEAPPVAAAPTQPTNAPPKPPAEAPAETPAEVSPTMLKALMMINDPDNEAARDYQQRHALLKMLEAKEATSARIDRPLQQRFDLMQAHTTDDPCATFSNALAAIGERATHTELDVVALTETAVPKGCDGLAARVKAVRNKVKADVDG